MSGEEHEIKMAVRSMFLSMGSSITLDHEYQVTHDTLVLRAIFTKDGTVTAVNKSTNNIYSFHMNDVI